MQVVLSPKKYIQTKARSLPIYKCIINKGWKVSKLANINILRRHVNGKVTAGVYLIDLLCLGIKDTFYFFNVHESEVLERYGNFMHDFEEIDYNLAHNIIYAGHDFAQEFNIEPHPDFEISKFILEEDNDAIPLIDITVGDQDGNPHLFVENANQYRDALVKLEKYAGEGNYAYTVLNESNSIDEDEYEDENEDEDEDENDNFISDYAIGEIDHKIARGIRFKHLPVDGQFENRTYIEQCYIMLELQLRLLRLIKPDYAALAEEFGELNYDLIDNAIDKPQTVNDEAYFVFEKKWSEAQVYFSTDVNFSDEADEAKVDPYFNKLLAKYSDNVQIVSGIFENINATEKPKLYTEVKTLLQQQSDKHPLALLSIVAHELFENEEDVAKYKYVYEAESITHLFPQTVAFTLVELNYFFLIKLQHHLNNKEMKQVVYYYELLCDIGIESIILIDAVPTINRELKALDI
ncbi:MAG: hypothetical protein QM541_01205 [Flavobacterium sp.]|nr:hypothetical protein [Flavobacterium sp.]